jgi:hypothetical protein
MATAPATYGIMICRPPATTGRTFVAFDGISADALHGQTKAGGGALVQNLAHCGNPDSYDAKWR